MAQGSAQAPIISHSADTVSVVPYGDIQSADAQGALEELDDEKVAIAGDTMTSTLDIDPSADVVPLKLHQFPGATSNIAEIYSQADALASFWAEAGGNVYYAVRAVTAPELDGTSAGFAAGFLTFFVAGSLRAMFTTTEMNLYYNLLLSNGDGAVEIYPDNGQIDLYEDTGDPVTSLTPDGSGNLLIGGVQAATIPYVDAAIQGRKFKNSVQVASTGDLTLSGEQTIDGVLTSASRILVKDQVAGQNNGIYVTGAGAWSRSDDANTWAEIEGMAVFVEEGTVNANTGWIITTDNATLGVTPLSFTKFTGLGQITAGAALTKTGDTLDVNVDNTTVEVNADALRVKPAGLDSSYLSDFTEAVQDVVGAFTGDSGLAVVTYSDVGNSLDINVPSASAAEVTAGASTTKAITPDALNDSMYSYRSLTFTVDEGGSVITTGEKKGCRLYVPFDCVIQSWTILSIDDVSSACTFDIWKDTYANYPATVADTIINTGAGGVKPAIAASGTKATSSSLSNWTTQLTQGDVLGINVDANTAFTLLRLILLVKVQA